MGTDLNVKAEEPLLLSDKVDVLDEDDLLDIQFGQPEIQLKASEEDVSISAADRVYGWLMNAPVDRLPGWSCYLEGLVRQGVLLLI